MIARVMDKNGGIHDFFKAMRLEIMYIIGGLIFVFAALFALTAGQILPAVVCGVISFCLFVKVHNATLENGRKFESKSSSKA